MPAISHSYRPVYGPVFARSGMVSSTARMVLWRDREEQQRAMSGWFSYRPNVRRPMTRPSLIPAFSILFACLRDKLPVISSKPNGSAPTVTASQDRESIQ